MAAGSRTGSESPARAALRREVADGLSREQKELSPRWFYDRRGSELFEAITRLPEYYPTRAEHGLLERHGPGWVAELRPRALVELGAGSAGKTRVLLDALTARSDAATYVPIDISGEFLDLIAGQLRADYPTLRVAPVRADIAGGLPLPATLPRPALFLFLGGTIGNFTRAAATALLRRVRARMAPGDRLLLGADLRKPAHILEAAYNDAAGVTAEFNLNALRVLNRELDADFDPADFRHRAFYDPALHRVEMHLVARRAVTVRIPRAGSFRIGPGESIRTEISCKYDRPALESLLAAAALRIGDWAVADPGFALVMAGAAHPVSGRRRRGGPAGTRSSGG